MRKVVRDGSGIVLLVSSLGVLFRGVVTLGRHDYVAALTLVVVGLALLGAAMELLRPGIGE
ncbi:MAG: hypothetical protein H5U40_04155 [Polyangiaceae bacterium]|nr:hypothetical protein [Polyangiaceae bacterium]